ncbi:MAG: 50S ribosomal protein L35 [Firmicutes bacterium]|nr:50S ribosomal protein L35 [Bacillota bacterium]
MPKMKSHRGAGKRFRVTSTGIIVKNKAGRRHILEKKTPKRKRNMRRPEALAAGDQKVVARMIPYK